MIKRIISGAMSLIVSCSLLTSVDIFNQKDVVIKNQVDNQISGNEDYNLNSTNSLGNYICEVATEQQRLANTASAAESEIFAVSQLEFDNISGEFIVKSSQTKACTAKVSIVEETSGETVLEKTADVKIGEDVITKGTINVSELPEFYYVTAELFDAEGKSLCSKITCETYTKTMQEILAADIHDFDENLVVNLDESEDTNFLVLDEETIIAESSEDTNNLESADYENNVFVFNNADETIQDLKEGDNFYIQASEQDIIAVSVDSVEVNENNQVIVSGNDENVEEMFSFIKFEGTADTSDAEFDMSTADEGVELDGMVEASNFMENVDAFKININGTSNKRGLFDVDKNFEAQANVTFPIEDKDAGFKASIEVGFKVSFSIYKKRSYVNLELKSEFPFKVSATLGETPSDDPLFEKSFGTAVIPLPVAGIKLEIEPKLVVEAKVTVEASYSATPGFSLTYDSDVGVEFNKLSDSFNSNEKFSLNVSGEAFIGIDFSPRLVAVSEKIAKIEVGLKTGLKITAEMENSISEGNEFTVLGVGYCGDSVHACGLCIKGTADFVLEGSAKLKVLFAEVEASINIGRFSLPDWYFSISNKGKFGLGTCPNLAYNTTFTILDKDGAPVSGAKVVVDSNEYYTDGNGFVNLYAKCQGHSYSVYVDGVKKKSGSFTIYNNTKDLTIKLDGSSVVTNDTPVSTATTPVITTVKKVTTTVTKSEKQQMMTAIASGRLGDNINYIHYADGFMWIHGYGDMYDYSSCPFKYPEKITDIDIENEDPASGLNITSIGNNVFKNCVNVPEFNIPSTVKRIGHNAFYNCSEAKFTDFAFTSNLTSIGNYAFYNCNKLKFGDLKFSSKLTSIGSFAFYNCDGITNATIPGSVKTIGDNVFDDCSSLKTLVVKDGVGTIGNYILNKCIAVESVTFPFVGNTLENTNKSDSNYQLAARLFNSSVEGKTYYTGNYHVPYTLKKIIITGGTRIPTNAFEDLSEVTEIIIPDNVTSIGNSAFYRCTSMTTRNLTNKLTSIGSSAFYNCNAAKFNDIVFPSTLTYIGASAFYNCDKITNVTIPGSVKTIGDYAFEDCSAIKTLVVKDGVGTIGSYILNRCIAVESVTFPFVGDTLENTNKSDSNYQLARRLFNSSVEGKTYYTGNYYVPYTLKKITITGGTRIPANAFEDLSEVTEIIIPDNVTSIGNNAFYNCTSMTTRNLTNKLTSIGSCAFYNCNAAKFNDIVFPSTLTYIGASAFYNCDKITNVTIPGSVNTIGDYAFEDCSAIKTLVVKDGVGTIGSYILNKCIAVESVTFPYVGNTLENTNKSDSSYQLAGRLFNSSVEGKTYYTGNYYVPYTLKKIIITGGTRIPTNAFEDLSEVTEIIIPDNVTSIGKSAFYGCSSLITIQDDEVSVFPDTIKSIEDSAFNGCTSLKTTKIPSKIVSIGNYAFANCSVSPFKNVVLPSTLTFIGSNAFLNCDGLTSVTVPGSVKTIGDYAFADCSALKTLVVKDGVGTIGSYILNKCIAVESVTFPYVGNTLENTNKSDSNYQLAARLFNSSVEDKTYYTGNYYVPYSLKKITITGGTRIPANAFEDLSEVTEIIIPNNVTSIGKSAFYRCTSLTSRCLTDNLVSIGSSAFYNCNAAKFNDIVFPDTLTSIGSNAFYNCDGITNVTIPGSVNTIGDYAFEDCSSLKTLVVKDGVGTIGSYILNKCIAVESVTLPFVGDTLENTNMSTSSYHVASRLFNSNVEDKTYYAQYYYVPYSLKKITITGGTRIPKNAFYKLKFVEEINIPKSITSIGNNAFYNCSNIDKLLFLGDAPEIASNAFTDVVINAYYPAENKTWTDDVKKNYEGSIKWVGINPLKITAQPKNAFGTIGSIVKTSVSATGDDLTYEWYVKDPGKTSFTLSSNKTATYKYEMEATKNERQVYCVIKDKHGNSVTSDTVICAIPASITKQPTNVSVAMGSNAAATITATGNDLTYKWYYKDVTMSDFKYTSTFKGDTYKTEMTEARDGRQIYCEIIDKYGNKVKSKTITLRSKVTITNQPSDVSVKAGSNAIATVKATGNDLTYKWYFKDSTMSTFAYTSTFKGDTYKVEMNTSRNGRQIYCEISDKYGNKVQSETVTLTIFAITKQPADVSVKYGNQAVATVEATGNDLTYKWYFKDTTMSSFAYTSTFKGNSYNAEMTEARDGRQIYCIISDKNGNKIQSKTITLRSKVAITKQPADVSVKYGNQAVATVEATGNDLTYKWYFKDTTMSSFAYTSTFKGNSYKAEMTEARDGRQIYCEISDKYGNKVQSETVTLTSKATITKQPADVSVKYGNQAVATVEATGNDLTYKWYFKDTTMSSFAYTSTFKGNSYKAEMTEARDGRQIYCEISDKYGNKVQSETVTLMSVVSITEQPVDVAAEYGSDAIVTINAAGKDLTYEWYYKNEGMKSFAYTSSFDGDTYEVEMSEARDGRQIYCEISDKYGNKVQSETVTLMSVVSITEQPVDVAAEYGSDAIVTINAAGKDLTYEWYYKNESMKSFAYTSSFDGDTYEVEMSEARDGRQVYCVISDKYGNKVQSETVTLTSVVSITEQPTDVSVESGSNAAVTINAAGKDLTYEWYYKNVGMKSFAYTSSFDGDTYEVEMNSSRNGRQIYCVITDKYGNKVETDVVTLSIK